MLLANDPFNLRPWEIAKLTRYQVQELYFCARGDGGKPLMAPVYNPPRDYLADFMFINNLKPWMMK